MVYEVLMPLWHLGSGRGKARSTSVAEAEEKRAQRLSEARKKEIGRAHV